MDRSFELDDTGEYVFKSVITILKASFLIVAFASNGIIDILIGLLTPMFVILLALARTEFKDGNVKIILPAIIVLLISSFIFNFLVIQTQVRLFSNGLIEREKQEDVMKIIEMFHGNVLIINLSEGEGKVLFEKRK